MYSDFDIERSRQQYLDLIHRYLQGRLASLPFQLDFEQCWAEERDELWRSVWKRTQALRCTERTAGKEGRVLPTHPSDLRRLPRMLDRLSALCIEAGDEEPFRSSVDALLTAYRRAGSASPEAQFVDKPPRINLFERPLPTDRAHHYPCTLDDIRAHLAEVPEYDLVGIWAIGLAPCDPSCRHVYASYYRWYGYRYKPVIFLYSVYGSFDRNLGIRADAGYIKRHFGVDCRFGMKIEDRGGRLWRRWPPECLRRYMVDHVLLHEIGHHVQYEQRWREGQRRWLPSHVKEQFAEDYAIRFERERKERVMWGKE
jgi:hypothetical protein